MGRVSNRTEKTVLNRIGWYVLAVSVLVCVFADMSWAQSANGRIEGRLVRKDDGIPVDGARVAVKDSTVEVVTDEEGAFAIELPPGSYTLLVAHADFPNGATHSVTVEAGATATVSIEISSGADLAADEYVVTEKHKEGSVASMLDERKNADAVADVIGSEQIAKSGDSNTASALKRVTGLTLVDDQFIYVRGMGERYSATMLNGSILPSPEPERRVVPLDIFPAGMLRGVMIQKTYSPDLPGEFGGGAVLLETRGLPDGFVADAGISGNWHAGTTGERGLMYEGGSTDWLGIDDGDRQLPGSIDDASADQPLLERDRFSDRGYTADQLEKFGEEMPNVWELRREDVPMDTGASVFVGHRVRPFGIPIGGMLGVSYDNSWDLAKSQKSYYIVGAGNELELQHQYDFETLEHSVNLGGILGLGLEITPDHKIKSTTMLLRITDDETRVYEGRNRDVATDIEVSRIAWIERQMFYQQVTGEHVIRPLADIEFDWRFNYAKATRDEPDRREARYDFDSQSSSWLLSDRPEGNQRVFSDLGDELQDLGADLKAPFKVWNSLDANVKTGATLIARVRDVDTRRFKYQHKGAASGDPDILRRDLEDIFTPANIGSDGFQFEEVTRETDNYEADQDLLGVYAMADLPVVVDAVRIVGGARYEQSSQEVETFELFNPDQEPVVADLDTTDVLPAANIAWSIRPDMIVRGAYGRTLSRPDFREMSPATYNDVTGGREVFGNPDLERTLIDNSDIRWEWYFASGEAVSLGLFHKNFTKPIETIVVPSAQQSVTYENADGATNYGVEIDFRKDFAFAMPELRDLYLMGNYAWIQSQVELGDDAGLSTEKERALQGQSPWVVNATLGYDQLDWGTSATLLYNVFGPRIVEVGALNAPDIMEEPVHQLDFVASQKIPWGFKVSLKAKNLIDLEVRKTQGDEITERTFKGREIGLGLSWHYE